MQGFAVYTDNYLNSLPVLKIKNSEFLKYSYTEIETEDIYELMNRSVHFVRVGQKLNLPILVNCV